MKKILIFTFVLFTAISCKSRQKEISSQDNKYKIRISFISIGTGTDKVAKDKVEKAIEEFQKQKGKELKKEINRWGREGEFYYCFKLEELKKKDQKLFVEKMKEVIGANERVRVEENQPCGNR